MIILDTLGASDHTVLLCKQPEVMDSESGFARVQCTARWTRRLCGKHGQGVAVLFLT